ncbi:MAG TPA: ATP-binding protein [Terriglobales bacterium]|nr:ATP-binding protein [Terriglobales bacterium]
MQRAHSIPTELIDTGCDASLAEHLRRIGSYMEGCGLLLHPVGRGPVRDELASFLQAHSEPVVAEWVRTVGEAFSIPAADRGQLRQWMSDAYQRWVHHVADPTDVETYVYLRNHARHAFISGFPASRFLAGQMMLQQILSDRISRDCGTDIACRDRLVSLLQQEFQERLLNISDFFVEAREEELREQEASYQKAIDNAPAAIFRLDQDVGTILDANIVAERTLSFPRAEMIGMRIWDLIPQAERPKATRLFEETRSRGHSNREDLHLQRRDGKLVPVFFSGGLIEYRQRRFFQVICVDISDRKRLESQLIQSEKMAAVGQLAAGIAHEIRNPLGIITNALYDLGEIVQSDDPDVGEDLRIAKEEMRRVQDIINNLLEFSRESKAEVEPVDINELLRRTLQLLTKGLQKSGVHVVTDFGPLGICRANQNGLRQVVLNLITNAVQAMPSGGTLTLRTRLRIDGRVQLDVSDTGVGIPPEHLTDIFNPFFTTKDPGQGTGLGLSVVHSVVHRYGGEIRVESQLGRGTSFTIELPCPCENGAEPDDQP